MKIFRTHIACMVALVLASAVMSPVARAGRVVDPLFRSGVETSACANGLVEDGEQCDGANLGGATCASIGLVVGALACTGACRFDASACIRNLPPSAVDDVATFDEDTTPVQFGAAMLTSNDSDADGDTLALVSVSSPSHGSVALQAQTVRFMVDPNFNGMAGFDYTIGDGEQTDTAHVSLQVVAVNDPPIANATSASTLQNIPVLIGLSGSDVENSPLTFSIVAAPTHGQLGAINATGPTTATVTYTPATGYFGSDGFTYRANDGGENAASALVGLAITQVVCGDGLIRGTEECDDHNNTSLDGCSMLCLVESGFVCNGEPSVCVPL